ncbi:MAG: hypothetical protein M3O46_06995, partial [Myxococcota bacterium]|nr:hypothetical protein [Myxococcota bacterium]
MRLLLRAGQLLLGTAVVGAAIPSCYSAGTGTDPPPSTFYFPIGLAVSDDGKVLYAANSDFDLQYNGGTLQSYNLTMTGAGLPRPLRNDAVNLIKANLSGQAAPPTGIPFIDSSLWHPSCASSPPPGGVTLGEACSPPVDSSQYVG